MSVDSDVKPKVKTREKSTQTKDAREQALRKKGHKFERQDSREDLFKVSTDKKKSQTRDASFMQSYNVK